ncbi:hypothetical protein IFM89_032186 [Coptis chinensis]|uniref:L-2-hydroxyglutarate dehydrogenase, mitochondrial n=1 Tax=Coptis chinensis TaxID=261450 RepID=A0A835J137_9MAGN|nr:hypothetical protein IFM89_032186 [Coptis chinensis]
MMVFCQMMYSIARDLAQKGRDVLVIESASTFGSGTSSRNNEVFHAGIYYTPNSLKAIFWLRGRKLLYQYCANHGVPHKQIGKLIVATVSSEIQKLIALLNRGRENGVEAGEAENHGATFSYNTAVVGGHLEGDSIQIHISQSKNIEKCIGSCPPQPELILIPNLVNSAGLSSPSLARSFKGLDSRVIPPSYYARGCYFTLSNAKTPPFEHLSYPIPEDGVLEVQFTLDLDGHVKFRPDVEWIGELDCFSSFLNKFDYSVSSDRVQKFYPEIRRYYPNLKDGSLEPGYAGIRPKLSGPGQPPVDFIIQGEDIHGVRGVINLFGIESPGLTSSLAIAEHIG